MENTGTGGSGFLFPPQIPSGSHLEALFSLLQFVPLNI